MRCIDGCGYQQKPDNLDTLVRHIEECLAEGACQRLKGDPFVIWKDGGFVVVERVTKKDRVFPITLIKKIAIKLTDDLIKTGADVYGATARGANASRASLEVNRRPISGNKKAEAIRAKLRGDI